MQYGTCKTSIDYITDKIPSKINNAASVLATLMQQPLPLKHLTIVPIQSWLMQQYLHPIRFRFRFISFASFTGRDAAKAWANYCGPIKATRQHQELCALINFLLNYPLLNWTLSRIGRKASAKIKARVGVDHENSKRRPRHCCKMYNR